MAVLLIVLVALGLAGISTGCSLYEARLARRSGEPPSATLEVGPTPAPAPQTLHFIAPTDLGIVSRRARCGCGDALETHAPQGPCEGCTCARFSYAGGLVAKAS